MTEFYVIAQVTTKPEHDAFVAQELHKLAAASQAEDGCVEYKLCQNAQVDCDWLIYEIWQSEAHWRTHLEQPPLLHFKETILPNRAKLTATKLSTV